MKSNRMQFWAQETNIYTQLQAPIQMMTSAA
jgi:hypothetical protein